MPLNVAAADKPARVAHCRTRTGHPRHQAGCPDCRAYSTYVAALRRWEKRHGISRSNVAAGPIQAHLQYLVEHGNLRLIDISEKTGIPVASLWCIFVGRRSTVMQMNAQTILQIEPRVEIRPPLRGLVSDVEGRRLMRGLAAQGWHYQHISELMCCATRDSARNIAVGTSEWMHQETLDKVRVVADKLRPYDVTELDQPLPGMDLRCARGALRKGWVPLRDWDGLDITDPHAEPFRAEPAHLADTVPAADGMLVDYVMLRRRVAAAAEDLYAPPLTRLTTLETYAIVALAQEAGISGSRTGAMLGYPQSTKQERDTGERQASRMRSELVAARLWFDTEPDGEAPPWFDAPAVRGRADFGRYLPALLAVQPEPFGYGMTLAQVAERCGVDVTLDQVTALLGEAVSLAGRPWSPAVTRKHTKARRKDRRRRAAEVGERAAA